MPKKSSIAVFIAATSVLSIATTENLSLNAGENDLGGLKEWNTDMSIDAELFLNDNAKILADKEAK